MHAFVARTWQAHAGRNLLPHSRCILHVCRKVSAEAHVAVMYRPAVTKTKPEWTAAAAIRKAGHAMHGSARV